MRLQARSMISAQLGLSSVCWASTAAPRQVQQAASFQDQCASFAPADAGIANATVTNHAFVAAGTTLQLTGNEACGLLTQPVTADMCRVSLQIATSDRSGVVTEIWLPQEWNGRLVTTGNGGLAGCELWEIGFLARIKTGAKVS